MVFLNKKTSAQISLLVGGILLIVAVALLGSLRKGDTLANDTSTPFDLGDVPAQLLSLEEVSDGAIDILLEEHNKKREELGLASLSWSSELAKRSETRTKELVEGSCSIPEFDSVMERATKKPRESIYISSYLKETSVVADSPEDVVSLWIGQSANYNSDLGICAEGEFCAFYETIAMADINSIGCSMGRCKAGMISDVWTCLYE